MTFSKALTMPPLAFTLATIGHVEFVYHARDVEVYALAMIAAYGEDVRVYDASGPLTHIRTFPVSLNRSRTMHKLTTDNLRQARNLLEMAETQLRAAHDRESGEDDNFNSRTVSTLVFALNSIEDALNYIGPMV